MRSAQGHIKKLGTDHWRIWVEAPRDPATGKRRRLTRTVRGSRKAAERVKHELLAAAGAPAGSDATIAELFDALYIPAKVAEGRKARTIEGYQARFERYIRPQLGAVPAKDLGAPTVRRWLGALSDRPAVRLEAYKLMNQLCRFAVYEDKMASNPCDRVRRPKVPRYKPRVLDAEQAVAYLRHFEGHPIEAAVIIALGCGLRRGEICALDAADIDLETGAVTVDDAMVTTREGTFSDTTKNNSTRVVHMPGVLLRRFREIAPHEGPLLAGRGGRMKPDSLTQAYERRCESLPEGVPYVPLKNLRHTSLTLAWDSGARLLDVRDRGGHTDQAVTARYYLRPKRSVDARVAEGMSELLEGVTSRDNSAEAQGREGAAPSQGNPVKRENAPDD